MKKLYTAIVLRSLPHKKNQYAFIDQKNGRIDVFSSFTLIPGMCLTYTFVESMRYPVVQNILMQELPLDLAKKDLLFLHHILELCYYFIPIGSATEGIFELLCCLYEKKCIEWKIPQKKLFVAKLLVTIGLYPELDQHLAFISQISSISIDMLIAKSIDLENEKMIDKWLHACIVSHPNHISFNTITFLTSNRCI